MIKLLNLFVDVNVYLILFFWQKIDKRRFFILADRYGRIGNQLYMSSFVIKWAKQYDALVILAGLHPYDMFFEKTNHDFVLCYPPKVSFLSKLYSLKEYWTKSIERISLRIENSLNGILGFGSLDLSRNCLDTDGIVFSKLLFKRNIIFIRGFVLNKTFADLKMVHSEITNLFRPRDHYLNAINKPLKYLSIAKIKVGVVIRHGDYKTWKDGKYFYPLKIYTQWMHEVCKLFGIEKVGFFIASDEDQPLENFKDFFFFFRYGHPVENLYSLSQCDYIITTESSFAGWACFFGKVPHFFVSREVRALKHEDFFNI